MALKPITEGLTGQEVAQIILDNDNFVLGEAQKVKDITTSNITDIDNIYTKIPQLEKQAGGTNIFNNSGVVEGKYLNGKTSGVETSGTDVGYNNVFVAVTPNVKYNTSLNLSLETCIVFYDSSKNFIGYVGKGNNAPLGYFTTPANCAYIRYNFLLSEGTSGYYISSSESGGGVDEYLIKLRLHELKDAKSLGGGTNIFDNSAIIQNKYLNGKSSGAVTGANGVAYNETYVAVQANTNYVTTLNLELQSCVMFYDSNKNFISYAGKDIPSPLGYFITPANCAYIRYNFLSTDGFDGYIISAGGGTSVGIYFDDLFIPRANIIDGGGTAVQYPINSRNSSSFIGSQNTVLDALITKKPRAKYFFISHFTDDYLGKDNTGNLTRVQKALAKYWATDILMLSDKLRLLNRDGINSLHSIVTDDLHPGTDSTGQTVEIIAGMCADFLRPVFDNWEGKKIAWYGTSIPYGHPNPALYAYPVKVAAKLGASIQNYAVSGSVMRLTTTTGGGIGGRHSFLDLGQTINYKTKMLDLIGTANEPDIYVFDYGINDWGLDKTEFIGY